MKPTHVVLAFAPLFAGAERAAAAALIGITASLSCAACRTRAYPHRNSVRFLGMTVVSPSR